MIRPGETIRELLAGTPGREVTARGWVRTRRDSSQVHFLQLNDGSCLASLQVVIPEGRLPEETLRAITTGACVSIRGELVESPAAGQALELLALSADVLGTAPPEYPIQKKRINFDTLREMGHLRVRTNALGAVFRVRSVLSHAIHTFFQERGFLYVHTPIITTADCEGAGKLFGVTTLDLMNLPRCDDGSVDFSQDFFGKPAFLTVSGQLEAEIFALAFSNVYTFGPTFRAENSNTPRHLAEFWMIEPEMAFCDLDDNRRLAEEFLKEIIAVVLEKCSADLELFQQRVDDTLLATLEHVVTSEFEHLPYSEAVRLLEQARDAGRSFEFAVGWGKDLQSEHERYLTEEVFRRPVVVTDYPAEIKAFYMRQNDDGRTVRAMDVLVPRVGEIIGGSQREERGDLLGARMHACGLHPEDYRWYLDLRRFGSAPHSGFGLGLERMMMYLTGMKNIREVVPFPRYPGSAAY